jgi:uncharacterized protein (UPF0332 family)
MSAVALTEISFDGVASRAYYSAFHAVSAFFALDEIYFTKHSALRAAVHRDLVKSGKWAVSFGEDYSLLMALREAGDYGGERHVNENEAKDALAAAERIIRKVASDNPDFDIGFIK